MFESMFIGLSGMHAYSNGLRQVSNNITNLNSAGYRASSVGFSDLFQSGEHGISYSDNEMNGDGVKLSELRLDFTQGELRQTERDLDLAIDGGGFLVLERDGEYYYTRTGNFEVDNDGYIVLSGTDDYRLTVMDEDGRPQVLSIDSYRTNSPEATSTIKFADNLSSTATTYTVPDVKVYDATGKEDTWQIEFTRDEDAVNTEWDVKITNAAGEEVDTQKLKFINGVIDSTTEKLTFEDEDNKIKIELDFSENVTSFSSGEVSTLRTSDVNGYALGEITSVSVNEEGILEINYSNEQEEALGAVTLADFREPQELEQRSGGLFTYDGTVGREFHSSESERVGRVLSRRSEASNVDLSNEFGDLILVQRGYQAASQVVSVSNDMIQQLFGIRGQG